VALPDKLKRFEVEPLHKIWFDGAITVGLGLIVIKNVLLAPLHVIPPPVYCDNTEIVDVIGDVPELLAVNEDILPTPVDPRPMLTLLLFQV
jgi:hypothetical protein